MTVLPSEVALSPTEAAELLGLSQPFVVRLLDEGEIPSERLPRNRHMLSLTGFTPVDRSRLGVSEVKALSKVDEIRASGARREATWPRD